MTSRSTAAVLDGLARHAPSWMTESGVGPGPILASRVRLARNLDSVSFPPAETGEDAQKLVQRVRAAVEHAPALEDASFLDLSEPVAADRELLVERRLISRDLADADRSCALAVTRDEQRSVMVNEEDHLRIQSVRPGLELGESLDRAVDLDEELDGFLGFAYSDELGYLTSCPTNTGTGLRASVLVHLPGLVLTRRVTKLMQAATAMNMAVRGFYGEGSGVMGNFIQISNQTTLGRDENDIVARLERLVHAVLEQEDDAVDTMWATARTALEDKIYRAQAVLAAARVITDEEVLSLTSAVRLGIRLGLPRLCPERTLNEILVLSRPAHAARALGRDIAPEDLDTVRADLIRSRLGGGSGSGNGNGRTPTHPPAAR